MEKVVKIHASKQPRRPHFIAAWAKHRHLKQVDIVREIGADKGTVSRWFKDGPGASSPGVDMQQRLAALFQIEPEALFRHPDDDWIRQFFDGRKADEIARMKAMLEAAFPRRDGTKG